MTPNGIVTLLTDFGTRDGYAAAMKGVILSEHPTARIVELTHEVPPQDLVAGAFAWAQSAPWFPAGTVHVGVVDPGVGTSRHVVVVEHGGSLYLAPDNGLLSLLPEPGVTTARVVDRLPADWAIHPTFHGRDLFARVAARLAAGDAPEAFSSTSVEPLWLSLPKPEQVGDDLHGEVIHVDRFGNLVTNLPAASGAGRTIDIAGTQAHFVHTYGAVERGRLLSYAGSAGYLEIAVRDGSAAQLLSAGRGTRLRLHD